MAEISRGVKPLAGTSKTRLGIGSGNRKNKIGQEPVTELVPQTYAAPGNPIGRWSGGRAAAKVSCTRSFNLSRVSSEYADASIGDKTCPTISPGRRTRDLFFISR